MTNKQVVAEFLKGRIAKTGHMTSTGDRLFSYNTCVAQHVATNDGGYLILVNRTKYSSTTSHQMSHLNSLFRIRGYESENIVELLGVRINSQYLTQAFDDFKALQSWTTK